MSGSGQRRSWELGKVFVLRHAGFPFDWLEELGFSAAVLAQADDQLALEDALAAIAREKGGEAAEKRVREDLARGVSPSFSKSPPEFREKAAQWSAHRTALADACAQERNGLRERLRTHARDPKVQEAVFLSSPDMYENVWSRYVGPQALADNADSRRVERQAYTYLQRFCAKNETASFFGPMGYGTIEGEGGVELQLIPEQKRRRRVFLAFWAVQELAKLVQKDRRLRADIPFSLNHLFRREGQTLSCVALGPPVPVSPEAAPVLDALAEGSASAAVLGKRLGVAPEEIEKRLLPLLKVAAVLRGLRYPTQDLEVFSNLVGAVRALPASEGREHWLGALAKLDELRAQFERADLPGRRALLPKLEAEFSTLAGVPARRGEGQMYADRYVFYEEASSPFRLRFGEAFGAQLSAQLSRGLELSAAFGERVQRSYAAQVKERLGDKSLDFLSYAQTMRPDQVGGSQFSPVDPVAVEAPGPGVIEIEPEVAGVSAPGGRFALPDVCLGAAPVAIGSAPQQFEVIAARVHHHLLVWSWLGAFFEDAERYQDTARRWLQREPSGRSVVELALSRRNKGFYQYPGRFVAYASAEAAELGKDGIAGSTLSVKVEGERPVLRDASGEQVFLYLPLADFSTYPPFAALAHPLVLHAPLRHSGPTTARIRVGGAVYQRARWEANLSPLAKLNGLELFLAVRREARARGWPRFLFGRVPDERKPFLLDTASPFSAELLRHLVRDQPKITFEEMSPAPEQLWLRDERGRYTFELRMQAERYSEGSSEAVARP